MFPYERYIVPIIGVIGIIFGWVLNQVAQWYKGRKEDNRIRKEVLFYLLELEYDLERFNLDKLVEECLTFLIAALPEDGQTVEVRDGLKKFIYPHLVPFMKEAVDSSHNLTNESLKGAISKLSPVSPYLAYKLTSFTDILKRMNNARNYITSVSQDPSFKDVGGQIDQWISPIIENSTFADNQTQLLQFLRKLAFRIGPFTYLYHIRWERRMLRGRRNPSYHGEMKELMQELVNRFITK